MGRIRVGMWGIGVRMRGIEEEMRRLGVGMGGDKGGNAGNWEWE